MPEIVDYIFSKHFTVEEANRLIPEMCEIFVRVQALMTPLENPDYDQLNRGNGNGGSPPLSREERMSAAKQLLSEIQEQGIVIQDWRRGLIDFPHLRDGQEVFLCYELRDGAQLRFYHEIDAGYAGRKPL